MGHRYSPAAGVHGLELTAVLSQRGEKSGCCLHSLKLGRAKRVSDHSCRRVQQELQLSPVTKHGGVASVVQQSALQTKKQRQGAWPLPLTLPELTSVNSPRAHSRPQKKLQQLVSGCRAHYLQIQELVLQKQFSPSDRHTLQIIQESCGDTQEMPQRSSNHRYWGSKATKKEAKSPQFTPLLHIITALPAAASACREQHWDFTDLEPHHPSNPQRGWSLETQTTETWRNSQIPREYRLISNIHTPFHPRD